MRGMRQRRERSVRARARLPLVALVALLAAIGIPLALLPLALPARAADGGAADPRGIRMAYLATDGAICDLTLRIALAPGSPPGTLGVARAVVTGTPLRGLDSWSHIDAILAEHPELSGVDLEIAGVRHAMQELVDAALGDLSPAARAYLGESHDCRLIRAASEDGTSSDPAVLLAGRVLTDLGKEPDAAGFRLTVSGDVCEIQVAVDVPDADPADRAALRRELRAIDVATLEPADTSHIVGSGPGWTPSQLELVGVISAIHEIVSAAIIEHDLVTHGWSTEALTHCDGDPWSAFGFVG